MLSRLAILVPLVGLLISGGVVEAGVTFNANTDRLTASSFAVPTTGTVCFNVKPTFASNDNLHHGFLDIRHSSGNDYWIVAKNDPSASNSLSGTWITGWNYYTAGATTYTLNQNQWNGICYRWNASTQESAFYLNTNTPIGSSSTLTTWVTDSFNLAIGNCATWDCADAASDLAEIAFWPRELSDTEISNRMGGLLSDCLTSGGGPTHYWPLTSTSDLTDHAGSENLSNTGVTNSSDHPSTTACGGGGTPTIGLNARQTNGTDQCLQTASAIDLSSYAKLGISIWVRWDTFANDDDLLLELGNDFDNFTDGFVINPNSGGTASGRFATTIGGSGNYNEKSFTRPTAGVWKHYVFVYDRSLTGAAELVAIYVNGVSQSLTTDQTYDTSGNFGNRILYVMSRGCSGLWAAGAVAELAIYGGVTLGQTDVDGLYNGGVGADATTVQNTYLRHYWHLDGSASPETATTGGVNMTVTGATVVPGFAQALPSTLSILGGGLSAGGILD